MNGRRFFLRLVASLAPLAAAPAQTAHAAPNRFLYTAGNTYLVVEALRDDLLHFELAGAGAGDVSKPLYTTPMVAKTDYPGPTDVRADAAGVETPALRVAVAAGTLCVTVFDKVRQVELQTVCPAKLDQAWKGLTIASPATKNVYGLGQYFSTTSPDGDWLGRVWDPLANTYGAALRPFAGGNNDFSMFPVIYALGDGRQTYAFFLDQVYKQLWDFRTSPWQVGMWGDQIRWYVLSGPDLPSLRRSYMELTGRPPVPPRRSFGLWVSQFGFTSWDDVLAELASLRRAHIPVEGFAMDLQWFGGTFGQPDRSLMGSLTWDAAAFPDFKAQIRRLRDDEGVNLMPIEEPYISNLLPEYQALAARGYLARDCEACGPTYLNYNPWWGRGGMVDYTDPAAGDFWHDFRRQGLTDLGITDHWADLGEPEQYNAGAWYRGFPELAKHGQADVHNIYGFRWMESIERGYRRHADGNGRKRPFLLSRTGTAGIQRLGVGLWSGDIGSDWGNLRSQMNVQMNMSMSGVDYYGSDVGGFQRSQGGVAGGSELLYTEWLADSAALDVPVRPHAWNLDKLRPTAPSQRGDTASNVDNLRLRYRLAPYYYSLAFAANRTGDPVFPPLVHYYQDDPNVRQLGSEKLIGRDLLVALTADPVATGRSVYLPAGDWVDLRTAAWVSSRGETLADYPLYDAGSFRLPYFARAGAILPMADVDDATENIRGRRTGGGRDDTLRVRVYASVDATTFDLAEDDGETYDYESGAVAVTRLAQRRVGDQATVTVNAAVGNYAGMQAARPLIVELVARDAAPVRVSVNGADTPVCTAAGAPCYLHHDGLVEVRAGTRPLAEATVVAVTLTAAPPPPPSLYFVCRNASQAPASAVYAAGDAPVLGAWSPAAAVPMHQAFPGTWVARIAGLPQGAAVAWKCLERDGAGALTWQPGANNQTTTGLAGYGGQTAGSF